MFQYYDTILEGDIIPVQHKGDLLYYAYLSCSDSDGLMVPWDAGSITHVEWYIGARLIDRYPLKMPHVAKTYSELSETRLFQPLRFSYPIPMVCLQYEKMYLKVIGAPKASLRYTCHMVYMNLTPDERMKIATEPYSMHIEQHHEVNPDQLYIHAPIKYFITSEFQYTNVDSIELVVNGQRTSGPILPEYFSPYITPAELRSISYPTPQTIVKASNVSIDQGTTPPSTLWISKYNKLRNYDIVTSASSNSTFAYAATTTLGWISDPGKFGEETVYTVTASPNPEYAYKSTTSEGWTSTPVFGNTAGLSANTIVGSNVASKGNLLSATSYWLADTTYTADAVGQYNVYTSTGTLSNANVWNSSNTFGNRIPDDGEYSIVPSDAWPVLDENATTFWSNIQFGQTLYTQSITGNNASSNLNLNVVPAKLFDFDSLAGWVSNSAANVYGYGSNAGVYAVTPLTSWPAFDSNDTTSWTGGNEFQAQLATIPNARMNAFSNVSNAWLASDYNDATAWVSNTLVYGHALPSPFLNRVTPTGELYGRTANIVTSLTATSNTGNVANALAWTNTLSWTSNLSFGQVTVPQGTYTHTLAPTTSYSNETIAAVISLSAGYTGFSAYTNSSVYFVTNPIPGLYVTNVTGAYNTTRISEATIATLVPDGEATKSRSNITGSLVAYTGAVNGVMTSNIFNKFPSGTFTQPTIELLSGTTYRWDGVFNASNGVPVTPTPALTIQGPTGSGTGNVAYTLSGINGTWAQGTTVDSNVFTLSTSERSGYDTTSASIAVSVNQLQITSPRQIVTLGTLTFPAGMVDGTTSFGTGASVNVVTTRTITSSPSAGFTPSISLNDDHGDGVFLTLSGTTISYRTDFNIQKTDVSIYSKVGQFTDRIAYYTSDTTTVMFYPAFAYNGETISNPIIIHGYVVGLYSGSGTSSLPSSSWYDFPTFKMLSTRPDGRMVGCLYPIVLKSNPFILLYTVAQVGKRIEVQFTYRSPGLGQSYVLGIISTFDGIPSGHSFSCYKTVRDLSGQVISQNESISLSSTTTEIMNTGSGMYAKLTFIYVGDYDVYNVTDVHIIASHKVAYIYTDEMYAVPGFIPYSFTKTDAYPLVSVIRDRSTANLYAEQTIISSVNLMRGSTQLSVSGTYNVTYYRFPNPNNDIGAIKVESGYRTLDTRTDIQTHPTNIIVSLKRFDSSSYNKYVTIDDISRINTPATNPPRYVVWSSSFSPVDTTFNSININLEYALFRIRIAIMRNGVIFPFPEWKANYTHLYIALRNPTLISPLIRLYPPDEYDDIAYAYGSFVHPVDGRDLQVTSEIWQDNRIINFSDVDFITFVNYSTPSPLSLRVNYTTTSTQSSNTRKRIHFGYVEPNPSDPRSITVPRGFRTGEFTFGICLTQNMNDDDPYAGYRSRYWHYNYRFNTTINNGVVYPPVQTEFILLPRVWADYDVPNSVYFNPYNISRIYDISRVTLRITNAGTYNPTSRELRIETLGAASTATTLRITLNRGASHIHRIIFNSTSTTLPAPIAIRLGGQNAQNNIITNDANRKTWTRTNNGYFTENQFEFDYRATITSDISFNLSSIVLLDERDGVIGTLTSPGAPGITISPGFRTSIPNIGVTASLNTSAVSDRYRIQFDASGTPTNVFNVTQNRNENLQLHGRFANVNAAYTIFSNVTVSTVSPGTTTSHSHTDPPNSFRTVCSLSAVGWVPSGQLACSYTLAPYQGSTISLTFPRAVTVGKVDINSSYSGFQIFNEASLVSFSRSGNAYTFTTPQSISALNIQPDAPTSIRLLTLSNIIVYDDIGCRISPSIPGTTLTMFSGGVRLATTDGNVYTGYSFDASETRSLTNFRNKPVTFTTNVHANVASVGALLSITPTPTSISPSTVPNLSSAAIKNEFQLSFTVSSWNGTTPVINSNTLVANVFEGGRNQANAFITLASSQVYGGVMSSNLGSLYTVSARNSDSAAWVPAVIDTSYSRYSYTVTQSNVYQPSVYFKLIRPSGVELHKDQMFITGTRFLIQDTITGNYIGLSGSTTIETSVTNAITFEAFNDPSVYKNNEGGIALKAVAGTNFNNGFLRHAGFTVYSDGFQGGNFDFAWRFIPSGGPNEYTIYNWFGGGYYLDFNGTNTRITTNSPPRVWRLVNTDLPVGIAPVGIAPVGEYRLTPGVPPGLFTREGHTAPHSGTATLTFPRPVTVTRILVSGTSVVFNDTSYTNGEAILQTPVTSHTFTFSSFTNVTRILLFNARGLITPRLVGTERTPTGNYWVSNTLSSNVLVTPPVFGWTFPNANVTGYTITSSQRLPYKLNVSSGATVLDRWVNLNAQSYTTIFPAPRQLTSLGCNVLELVDTSTIDCSLQLIVYSCTFTSTSTISSNIYGPPVFCTVSGPSVPTGSRTVISNLQSGTDITTFDFGANVVNIRDITYSTLTTLTTTPGLLRILGPSVSVVGRLDSEPGVTYRGQISHPDITGSWNGIQLGQQFSSLSLTNTSPLQLGGQTDLYPFSQVGIQLGGTLGYTVISSLTYMVDGHLYAYRLQNVGTSAIVNAVPGATFVSEVVNGVTYDRITITFPDSISQIQVYGITVTATTPKPNWNIWCRPSPPFGIVTTEGGTPLPTSVTIVTLPTQPPFSNIFGVRMSRSTPCHFSNIILYNNLGAAVNTNDVRGRGLESFSFTPQSPVQFKSYSFISDPPITSWTLKHGLATIDSVLLNSNVNVYRELPTSVITSGAITLEISNAVGRAQISDFKLYSEAYQMVTSNATASVMYGSALAGRYAIYTSSSPTYENTLMAYNSGFYTRVNGALVEGPWIQIEMPIRIVVSKCFFYGNHRLYTLLQSSDGGASWTTVCTGDADVYREIPPLPPAQFFRFVCSSIYGTQWNVDIALCNSLGERLNARHASGYIRYPNYFGGLSRSSPQTISYTVPSPLSNIYFRDTNVSNVIIGGRRTTMTVVSDGFRQFTPSTPITAGTMTNIVIDGIDNGTTATWTDIELLDATHRPMVHRGNVMVSTVPQGYYEFSGNRITFPVAVTPAYSNISGTLSGTGSQQYTLQPNEVLYDADFKRLTPVTRSNGFVRDIVYSGSNAVTQRQFIYFDAGSSRGANSYTFTCDPPPIRWTLECDGVAVHSQTTPNWSTNTTYTSLIQNGCTGRMFTLSIDAIQSTTSNSLRISSFGVYNDQALLLTPQFTSNTVTAPRFYTSTQAKGYFEVEPESQTNFVFNGAPSSHSGDIIIRLPCFVRIDRCTLASGLATFSVSTDGSSSSWVEPSRAIMALYIRIQKTSPSMQGLSIFINSTQCII